MIFTKATICGICCTLPKETLELKELAVLYGEKTIQKIAKATGIEQVHIAPREKTTADYCFDAATALLEILQYPIKKIDGIVFVSQTPDYILPATSVLLQERLGIQKRSVAFDINYGCSGYVYGLLQAHLLVETGCCRNVLVCVGDTITRYIHPEDKALRLVLGDGASATLVCRSACEKSAAFATFTDGSRADRLMIPAGGSRRPAVQGITDQKECDAEGNIRSQEHLYMDGLEIMQFALNDVEPVLQEVLRRLQWKTIDIDVFAFHQANAFIVQYLRKKLRLPKEKVPVQVKKTGNTGPTSIPLLLCEEYAEATVKPQKALLCGFGVGLSCAAMAADLRQTVYCKTRQI